MYRGVLCDLSGVVYVGDKLVPSAHEALVSLCAAGLRVKYITNISRMPRADILRKLARMGLQVSPQDLFTPATAARAYLLHQGMTPHLLIHPALRTEFADLLGPKPDAVLMGDAGDGLSYQNLNDAFRVLVAGGELLALGANRYFQDDDGLCLDAGPFVKALEFASGVDALILGKPSKAFFLAAVSSLGLPPGEVVMVGDDYAVDVDGALAAGLGAILVRTGKYRPGDERRVTHSGVEVCADLSAATDVIL